MEKPDGATSLWHATAGPEIHTEVLGDNVSADVVIIGGGYTGLSAALHLAESGVDVRLVEANSIGYGGSGRNVGLVNAGLWTPPDEVEAKLGLESGIKLNEILSKGPDLVYSLIERHGIACEAIRNGTLHCAPDASGLKELKRRHQQLKNRNEPVSLLDAAETERRTGSARFIGALLDRRAGTIQPLAYAQGLAIAAIGAGAKLHGGTPAERYVHDGSAWRVETPTGSVTANTLIMATNAYQSDLNEAGQSLYTPVHFFQLATQPLSDKQRGAILAGGEGCWDTATIMSSFRMDAQGRLIMGGVGSLEGMGAGVHRNWAKRKLGKLFPTAADSEFEYAWCGRIAMTSDHLPKVAEIGPNAISIYGYSGRGISPGTVFGEAAAQWAINKQADMLPLTPKPLLFERFTGIKGQYYEMGASLIHSVSAR